jgi:hypothetical protein
MEIKSVSRVYDLYPGHMRKTTYTTLEDANGYKIVRQVVEQLVLYSKFPVAGNGKGFYIDITV